MNAVRGVRRWILAVTLAAGSLTCSGDVTGPKSEPAVLERVAGDGQVGTIGQPLPESLVVRVKDGQGRPLGGVGVAWTTGGGGTVSSPEAVSGEDGTAAVQRVLGTTAGQVTTTAAVSGLPPVGFSDTARPAVVQQLVLITQPPASALDHEIFAPSQQPVAQLTNGPGSPVAGAVVTAAMASGGGTLEGAVTAMTGADGRAAFGDLGIAGAGVHTIQFSTGGLATVSSQVTITPPPAAATTGEWGPVIDWSAHGADIVPLQIHLLPTGKVLAWGKVGEPYVWTPPADDDPADAGSFQAAPVDTMLFCAGHAFLPDGRLLVSGGHKSDDEGIPDTHIFDPATQTWTTRTALPFMARGRWYPTVTILPDGRAVTVAGRDSSSTVVGVPELWDGSKWIELTGADRQFPYYPRDFVAPNGTVFYAGERVQTWFLDVDANGGTGAWAAGPSHLWKFERDYGSAVMYAPGKILYVGGGGDTASNTPHDATSPTPTNTAEIIDLNLASPAWTSTGSMQYPRRHLNATPLPDGEVLVTGGVSGRGFSDLATAVHAAEVWNPATGVWTTLASNAVNRGYHAVSLLLPNGTVLHGASGDAAQPHSNPQLVYPRETSHEIFSPPYLFKGNRPTIGAAPTSAHYGQAFDVQTEYAAQITSVSLIRLGSVTHAFDQNTRFLPLGFSSSPGHLSITAPASPNLAPPGYYLLFLLNRNGVPSKGSIILLQ